MKRLVYVMMLLLLGPICRAAITEHYIASDGTDTWANSTNPATPCSLSTALTSATAGMRCNIKAGTYTRTATDTPAASGTATQPIIWRGCDASWNAITPTRNTPNLLLDTTNYPVLAYNATFGWVAGSINLHILTAIKITGNLSGDMFYVGTDCIIYGCSSTNSSTGGSPTAVRGGTRTIIQFCDFACDGASGGATARGISAGQENRIRACYVTASKGYGIYLGSTDLVVLNNVISGCGSYGIYFGGTALQIVTVIGNTIYGGKGIGFSNVVYTTLSLIEDNHVTDNSDWAIVNLNATGSPIVLSGNRTRDTTSGAVSWAGDWDNATTWAHVTTDTGGPETDYVNAGGSPKNLNLISGAPSLEAGLMGRDIGSLQRVRDYPAIGNVYNDTVDGAAGTCTVPDAANVWHGTATYGNPGSPITPTKLGSSIPNCEPGNIKNAVVIDDVTGTYGGGGAGGGSNIFGSLIK